MWKYVTRRLRDTVERTCQQFDVTGVWPCEKFIRVQYKPVQPTKSNPLGTARLGQSPCSQNGVNEKTESYHSNGSHDHRHRMRFQHPKCLLHAIGLSYALLFGWYASQYLFLHRRKIALYCKYKGSTRHPHWAFCSRHLAASAPRNEPNKQQSKLNPPSDFVSFTTLPVVNSTNFFNGVEDEFQFIGYRDLKQLENVAKGPEKTQNDLDVAVTNLMTTVAEAAYQLALQSLQLKDYPTAIDHLKTAIGHNHAGAMFNLGICYEQGLGVTKDFKTALQCYQAASSRGHPKAMFNLGVFYIHGLGGVKKNRKAAMHYFIKAANLGQPDAKAAIGLTQLPEEPQSSVYDYVLQHGFVMQPVAIAI